MKDRKAILERIRKKAQQREFKRRALRKARQRYLARSPLPKMEKAQGWDKKREKLAKKKAKRRAVQKWKRTRVHKALMKAGEV